MVDVPPPETEPDAEPEPDDEPEAELDAEHETVTLIDTDEVAEVELLLVPKEGLVVLPLWEEEPGGGPTGLV